MALSTLEMGVSEVLSRTEKEDDGAKSNIDCTVHILLGCLFVVSASAGVFESRGVRNPWSVVKGKLRMKRFSLLLSRSEDKG